MISNERRPLRRTLYAALALCAVIGTALALHVGAVQSRIVKRTLPDRPLGGGQVTLLPNGWRVTPAGRAISLPGDMPATMLLSRDGRYLLVNTAGFHDHGVSVIDLKTETRVQTVDVGKDWTGMCLNAEGSDIYLSGGGEPGQDFLSEAAQAKATPEQVAAFQTPVMRLTFAGGKAAPAVGFAIPGVTGDGRFVAGLAAGPDDTVYVANLANDTV